MSATPITLLTNARDWRAEWQARWRDASPTTRTRVQVGTLVAAVALAYHYSLRTLIQDINLDTPLAYIGLVPIIALGLAAVRSRPHRHEPAIHDRQLDYIVGLPLIAAALAINFLMPHRLSAMFWVWRIDLLSLPFFVAGVTAILFGVRALWRQRLAIAYLFLAWPVPYSALLFRELNVFTNVTLSALRALVGQIHIAVPYAGSDGSVFNIVHRGQVFRLSVVSACSGVNGMVGFLLVGLAFGAAVTGPRVRKTLWLLGGLLLLWLMNVGRLLLIFWAGSTFGEHFAIKVLHPFVGLITFNIGIAIMVLLLKPVGLRIGRPGQAGTGASSVGDTMKSSPWKPVAVPAVYSAITIVAIVGLVLGVHNSALRSYDLVANATGEPKLTSYLSYPASPPSWFPTYVSEFTWAKPYFGESSKWYRYAYTSTTQGVSDLRSTVPVYSDVINSGNLSSFSAYGVEACYRFHGYSLKSVAQVNLGAGITGQSLSYSTKDHRTWSIVYWIWPVKNGTSTRYERVILYLLDTGVGSVSSPRTPAAISSVHGSLNAADRTQRSLLENRAFLVSFAHEVITGQGVVAEGSKFVSSTPHVPQPPQTIFRAGRKFVPKATPPPPPQSVFKAGQKWVPVPGVWNPPSSNIPASNPAISFGP